MLFYWVIMDDMDFLSIIDGDAKREPELLSFEVRSWCTQGIGSNASIEILVF